MQTIEKTIEVDRPLGVVYDQWTRFQDFPDVMEGITEVRKINDKSLPRTAEIGGKTKSWDAEFVEQLPDQRISWRSTSGAENSGAVTFVTLTPIKTRVILYISYDPRRLFENLGDNLGMVSAKVSGDLNRFKAFIESRDAPAEIERIARGTVAATP